MINYIETIPLLTLELEKYKISDIDNNLLKSEILQQQIRYHPDPSMSLFEDTIFEPKPNSEGEKLMSYIKVLGKERNLEIENYWTHVHKPLESCNTHNHHTSALSFCYYVNVPITMPYSGILSFDFGDGGTTNLFPQQGDLFLFPAWINHRVSKNLSNNLRISLAGNFKNIV